MLRLLPKLTLGCFTTKPNAVRFLISFFFCGISLCSYAQNTTTNYTPLYTSYNFTKTIDVSKPVGFVQGNATVSSSGGGYIACLFTRHRVLLA